MPYVLECCSIRLQTLIGIDRRKKTSLTLAKGANWVSLTDNFVAYLLSRREEIKKVFRYSKCADEMFVQTLIANSPFMEKSRPYHRYIDWTRGQPYTFTVQDYDEIHKNKDSFFVRKVGMETKEQSLLVDLLENDLHKDIRAE